MSIAPQSVSHSPVTANSGAPVAPNDRSFHRISEVRRQQGVSLRSVARQLGSTTSVVREQEKASSDLRISDLMKWQKALDVPLADLLDDPGHPLSRPVMERARLVRLMKTVAAIESGTAVIEKQPMTPQRPAPKLYKQDGLIDWSKDVRTIHNQVRGMNPAPGAYTECTRGPMKIHRTVIIEESSTNVPGAVFETPKKDGFVISCGTGSLKITELQPPGKKKMDCGSFARGCRLIEDGMSVCDL